jgi:hypothetical protein
MCQFEASKYLYIEESILFQTMAYAVYRFDQVRLNTGRPEEPAWMCFHRTGAIAPRGD